MGGNPIRSKFALLFGYLFVCKAILQVGGQQFNYLGCLKMVPIGCVWLFAFHDIA